MESFKYIRFLIACFFVISTLVRPPGTRANEPFTTGGLIIYPGLTLDPKLAYRQRLVSRECKCRSLCLDDEHCKCYTWIRNNDAIMCRQFDILFDELSFIPSSESNTAVTTGQFKSIGQDNLEYYWHPYQMDINEANMTCNALGGGFQLGIYKTMKNLAVLRRYHEKYNLEIWVDMMSFGTSKDDAVWRDGTIYSDTEVGKHDEVSFEANEAPAAFRYRGDGFHDRQTETFAVLCQRIPKI